MMFVTTAGTLSLTNSQDVTRFAHLSRMILGGQQLDLSVLSASNR